MAFDEQIAILTVAAEASGCSIEEQVAVAFVIKNRVPRWQPTIAGVCLQRMQFSEWNADTADNKNLLRVANKSDNDKAITEARQAYQLTSLILDPTETATHYHDKTISPPSWTLGATKTLETLHFIFYKDVK